MSNVVRINRTYATRSGEIAETSPANSWQALLARLGEFAIVVPFIAPDGSDGVRAMCATSRGLGGAYSAHDLACRYGAIAVIEY